MWILTVGVHLVNHILELSLGGVLPQGAHHRPELFGGDGAVAVFIKQRERLLELCKASVGAPVLGEGTHTFKELPTNTCMCSQPFTSRTGNKMQNYERDG